MAKFSEKELAAHVAALFSAEMIKTCFTGEESTLAETLEAGLSKTGEIEEAWDLTSELATPGKNGASTFNTAVMSSTQPEACIRLAEIFARGLANGYGSVEEMTANYEFDSIGKDPKVASALAAHDAPTAARIFQPVLN
jgi:hypothetical protein